jgi:hypothetical protein
MHLGRINRDRKLSHIFSESGSLSTGSSRGSLVAPIHESQNPSSSLHFLLHSYNCAKMLSFPTTTEETQGLGHASFGVWGPYSLV